MFFQVNDIFYAGGLNNVPFAGIYFTGDWAYRDADGDYQILGRQDDIVRVKGVWVQVPEIESSIAVSETLLLSSH